MSKINVVFSKIIASLLLICIVGCNSAISEQTKSVASNSAVRKSVSKCIEQQIEVLEQYDDTDVIDLLGAKDMTGEEIVSKALSEKGSVEYLDFCYAANQSCVLNDSSYIMNRAKDLMDTTKYNELKNRIDQNEKDIKGWAHSQAKTVPEDQQEAFYKDLKSLVVRTTVMLVAAFVYVAIPSTVVWGKIPAAAALSVGAGVAAGAVMDVYGYFKKGYTPSLLQMEEGESLADMDFEQWINKLKDSSAATYAIATAATTYISSTGLSPITGAIILGVFTVFNAFVAISDMKKKYSFDA